jgi:hypothetical protein
MTDDVKKIIEEGHLGVRTYQNFVDECLQRCASGDEDTVSLFVLAKIVQPFAEYYQDQALTQAEAVAFRQRLLSHIAAVEKAQGAGERLDALREVIQKELNAGGREG